MHTSCITGAPVLGPSLISFRHQPIYATMNIFVYKTDIQNEYDLETLETLLNNHGSIIRWNVDREDIDNVLRIESTANNSHELIRAITSAGYQCEELTD